MVEIRTACEADAAAIAAIYAPHVTAGVASFEMEAPDATVMAARMASSRGLYPWIVATEADAVIGYAYAGLFRERAAYRWMVETSVYLAPDAQRRGIGRILYGALLATLKRQGFTQALGAISLPNPASIALHEAVGFRRAGVLRQAGFKHGQWIDVGYWQRELVHPTGTPPEPLRFADIGLELS
ncbi:phosphinothricin acetyltransferase [Sphingomonas gellani]|uniref:Phosphinothricin acetyltransferase n=1 Tax=Sphingomonas gellani TaxID=1166340 RepID=A0A1H8G0G4_9SPHN|nr:GNAT family N-acetyltransferase [Sphingomonas gellani]SEN37442.1 phosphinothricin acetyltransferase [Sphingomonas gellani]